MTIFVTGDTHGGQPQGRFSVDGFMRRFSDESFREQKKDCGLSRFVRRKRALGSASLHVERDDRQGWKDLQEI